MTPNRDYRNSRLFTLIIIDLRVPGNVERLHSARTAWREFGDIELLYFDHAVLIVRPGAALKMTP